MDRKEDGWVRTIELPRPTLQNNTADADRLADALRARIDARQFELSIDLELMRQLPVLLRNWGYRVRCTLFRDRSRWVLTGMQSADDERSPLGLAIDLGTSRVVIRVVSLLDGSALAESAFDNPQIDIGPDILTRIHYASEKEGLAHLQGLIRDGINRHLVQLCRSCSREPVEIFLVAVAGNTTMTHLLLGLPPSRMIREPYIPAVNRFELITSAELGLRIGPHARVFIFPNIGSYFGGDLIAGLLYAGIHRSEGTALLVDVGTNAEVALGNKQWLVACAGAAGPALESGVTRMGMMAGPGVIDRVKFDRNSRSFELHTIGNRPPRGICGSGLIDLAAELFLSGMIDIRGRFHPRTCGDRLIDINGTPSLVLVPAESSATGDPLTISQVDLDSLIRSKAAMYTILETITATVGIRLEDLSKFFIAGTFGTFIQPSSAISIGMLPDLPLQAFEVLGNSSLGGATLMLTSNRAGEEIDRIRNQITYIELNVNQDFMNRFSAARFLPHTDHARFPTVRPLPGG